eukprot:1712703-Pyramimonas_sp.AAC.1
MGRPRGQMVPSHPYVGRRLRGHPAERFAVQLFRDHLPHLRRTTISCTRTRSFQRNSCPS